jgi:peptidoglycan/LPS O-acetylase OafA/YrhL
MQEAAKASNSERVPWLDGMRGVAILLVLIRHLPEATRGATPSAFDRPVAKVAESGWIGVDLFFVLSGMLITGILLDTKGSAGYWPRFYARRALRIFPLYFAFLAALLVLAPVLYASDTSGVSELRHGEAWFALFLANGWTAARHGANANIFGTGIVWSLSVEEQFYLLWPAIVLLLSRQRLATFCIALVVFATALRVVMLGAGVNYLVVYEATPAHCDALAIGALIAIALRDEAWRQRLLAYAGPASIVLIVVLVVIGLDLRGLDFSQPGVLVLAVTPIAMLMASLVAQGFRGGIVARCASVSWLRWLGRYSYAIYLIHLPIAYWLCREWRLPERLIAHGIPEFVADPICWLTVGTIACAGGWVSWHAFEKHFLKLKRFVRYERMVEVAPDLRSLDAAPKRLPDAA